ncbi:MAG: XRE family transcriptional regulator [Candidatus Omnitrophota bacterium]|nr:XRE family transcriptional regulator [Candidatus Omnitrophota bacterium]
MYIGKRLKEIRKQKRISLSELAQTSGVQIATLSRIEHLKMVGTLESHMKIAKALGVDITQIYSGIIKEEDKVDIRGPKAGDVFRHSEKSSYEILTRNIREKKMMPILLKIEAGGQTNKEQNVPSSEKFIYVLDGKINAVIGGQTYALARGNSLYFDAGAEHLFVNAGSATARAIVVVTPTAL